MKQSQRGFGLLPVLLVVLTISVLGAAGWQFQKHQAEPAQKTQSSVATEPASVIDKKVVDPATQKSIELVEGSLYRIKTKDGQTYYGHAQKINANYTKLSDVTYLHNGVLQKLGSELHGPESIMYFNMAQVASLSVDLTDAEGMIVTNAYKTLTFETPSDAFPNGSIDKYLKSGQYQAFVFADGKIYYAKTTDFNGNFLSDKLVFTMRTNKTGTMNDISLVKVEEAVIKGYDASTLVFWENLKSDGQVAKALDDYIKYNQ